MTNQDQWRYCAKCHGMFFDGYPDKGHCPAGGAHSAAGFNFAVYHDVRPEANTQDQWRFCVKCHGMFFDGYPDKGHCPAGGAHSASGYNFVLLHDVSNVAWTQDQWRYCAKCHGMFFDGYPDKGHCPAGGAHAAAGYIFVLPLASPTINFRNAYVEKGTLWLDITGSGFSIDSDVKFQCGIKLNESQVMASELKMARTDILGDFSATRTVYLGHDQYVSLGLTATDVKTGREAKNSLSRE